MPGAQSTSGNATETPTAVGNDTYTLSCTGPGGTAEDAATLTVNAPASQAFVYTLNTTLNNTGTGNISGFSESSAGNLTLLGDSPYNDTLLAPDSIAIDSQMNLLFAVGTSSGSQTTGLISAFAINPVTGSLSSLVTTTPAIAPSWVTVGPSGKFLYVSHHGTDSISAYSIAADGALTEVSGSPFTLPASNCGLFCEATADQMAYDPQAQTLYVVSDYGWVVATFTVDTTTGALTWVYNTQTGAGPSSVAVDPTGKFVYVTNEVDKNISSYQVTTSATSGGNPEPLTPITGQPFSCGGAPVSVAAEPTGHYLYVANSGDNTISEYQIDSSTGALTLLSSSPVSFTNGTTGLSELIVDTSGKNLYAASMDYDGGIGGVTQFSLDPTTGNLTQVGTTPYTPGTDANQPFQVVVYQIPAN